MSITRICLPTTLAMCWPAVASACPFCNSTTAELVREGIFNADFGYHLAVSLAPFPVLLGILMVIYCGPSQRVTKQKGAPTESTRKESPAIEESP